MNVCATTLPGHDPAAVVVLAWDFDRQGRAHLTALPFRPDCREARAVMANPKAYALYRDERLPPFTTTRGA